MRAALLLSVCSACSFSSPVGVAGDASPDAPDSNGEMLGACDAVEVVAAADHTCARAGDGSVYCWGRSEHGQLGVLPKEYLCAATTATGFCSPAPRKLEITGATRLGLGQFHSCSTTSTGTYCWGLNQFGQYGNGTTTDASPTGLVMQRQGASSIDAGVFHTCSLAGGKVLCSGKNDAGEVGNNMTGMQQTATEVLQGATSLGLGAYNTCAINAQKELLCWGRNDFSQIDATQQVKLAPTVVAGVSDATSVAAGVDHVCVVRGDRSARCWGSNLVGQIGDGATTNVPQPPTMPMVSGAVEVSAELYHTCIRDEGGGVWCFGEGYAATPAKIGLTRPAIAITAGGRHDCAITDEHQVFCWGAQDYGQLGNATSSAMRTLTPQRAKLCP